MSLFHHFTFITFQQLDFSSSRGQCLCLFHRWSVLKPVYLPRSCINVVHLKEGLLFRFVLVELLGKIGLFTPCSISTVKKATDKPAGKFNKTYRMIPTENSNLVESFSYIHIFCSKGNELYRFVWSTIGMACKVQGIKEGTRLRMTKKYI